MQGTTSKHDESVYFILKELNYLTMQILLRNKYYIWRYYMTTYWLQFSRYYSKWLEIAVGILAMLVSRDFSSFCCRSAVYNIYQNFKNASTDGKELKKNGFIL